MQKDFYLALGVGPTHSGSSDEVGEIPCAPMQDGFLDPFHVQEQSGVHGSRCREMSSPAGIICYRRVLRAEKRGFALLGAGGVKKRNEVGPLLVAWVLPQPLLLAVRQGSCLTSTGTASASFLSPRPQEGGKTDGAFLKKTGTLE